MKRHWIIKTTDQFASSRPDIPFWIDFISDKSGQVEQLHPGFDRLMAKQGADFWVTMEYEPREDDWSPEEVAAGLNRIYRVILRDDFDVPEELLDQIHLIPDFEYVRPIHIGESDLPVAERTFDVSVATDPSRDEIFTKQVHTLYSQGRPEVTVAILDTGVNLHHPEVRNQLLKGADFVHLEGIDTRDFVGDITGYDVAPEDDVGHGTHVAGIIAGAGLKMANGVVPHCKLVPVRVLAAMKSGGTLVGAGLVDNINTGIKWAVDQGADIINMSLGIKHTGGGLPHQEVMRYAVARGVTVVAASGNDGTEEKYYPGALPGVIAVGAMDSNGQVASFSSYGAPVALVAPGTNVYSSYAHESYAFASGTSQAAPFVSGAAALLKSLALESGVKLRDHELKHIFRQTSDKIGPQFRTEKSGYGRLNLLDACRLLKYMLTGQYQLAA